MVVGEVEWGRGRARGRKRGESEGHLFSQLADDVCSCSDSEERGGGSQNRNTPDPEVRHHLHAEQTDSLSVLRLRAMHARRLPQITQHPDPKRNHKQCGHLPSIY